MHDEAEDSFNTEERALKARFDEVKEERSAAAPKLVAARFVIIKMLGQGGMGAVYKAYDSHLERHVALKLVVSAGMDLHRQERLLREAKALARLRHTNVVTVHDAGQVDEFRVWVAMEFVPGETLKAWLKHGARRWEEVLAVFIDVARGLAAAHMAHIVHRDLKPDNVMIDEDGRARVMDFGLAAIGVVTHDDDVSLETTAEVGPTRGRLTQTGALLGTPLYMAPEQWRRQEVDARADQFSFCVTLWEALYGETPFAGASQEELRANVCRGVIQSQRSANVPPWLNAVLLRGLSVEPSGRFESMKELLATVAAGQAKMRRRRQVRWGLRGLAAASVLTSGALGAHLYARAGRVEACEATGRSIDEVWNDASKTRLHEGLHATGVSYAETTFEKMLPWVDPWVDAWAETRTDICVQAEVEHTLSSDIYDRSVGCLDERRVELASLLTVLSAAEPTDVQNAVRAAARLAKVKACVDPVQLALRQEDAAGDPEVAVIRRELLAARTLEAAGRYDAGLAQAEQALRQAEVVRHLPTMAEARYVAGRLAGWLSKFARAEELLVQGYAEAVASGADEIAARCASELAYTVGYEQQRVLEGTMWAQNAEVFVRRIGQQDSALGAEVIGNRANVEQARGDYLQAQALNEQALVIYERELGPDHPNIAFTLNNIGNALYSRSDLTHAEEAFERGISILERTYGMNHPVVAQFLSNFAATEENAGKYEIAAQSLQKALAIWEATLDPGDPRIAFGLINLGSLEKSRGHLTEARAALDRALRIQEDALGPDNVALTKTLSALGSVARNEDRYADAASLLARSLAIAERAYGPRHPEVASILNSLGLIRAELNELGEARALYERALVIYEAQEKPPLDSIANTLANIGNIDDEEARYEDAERRYRRALELRQQVFAGPHADIAAGYTSLAVVEVRRRNFEAARVLYEQAIAMYKETVGPTHPQVGIMLINLASTLQSMGRHLEAWEQLQHANAILLEGDVADTNKAFLFVGLGISGVELGRASEVIPLLEEALVIRTEYPATAEERLAVRFNLARALWDAPVGDGRDRKRARDLARTSLQDTADLHGEARAGIADVQRWLRTHRG